MRYFLLFFLMNFAICQTDFIKPSDFNDNPPNFPKVVLPSFTTEEIAENDTLDSTSYLVKGYRVQIVISQNVNELEVIQDKLMKSVDKKIYIIFELPNYKLRVGNFLNRKEAESFQKKIVRLGYRTAWVVPTMIEMED
tara:strand:- start:356 stop:769 length:414 start_codon:yes stop_codon:yes gene_type:complete